MSGVHLSNHVVNMDERYERTPSDVRDVIKHAKLHESELTPLTQVLTFSNSSINHENLKFLQLDSHLLEEIVSERTVVFKGGKNENAVLCTSTRTYDIKEAETSNSLLLVSDLQWGKDTKVDQNVSSEDQKENSINDSSDSLKFNDSGDSDTVFKSPRKLDNKNILKIFYTYYEPRLIKPKLRKLSELLQFTLYSGPEKEYAIDQDLLFSLDKLQDIIQCSDAELIEALKNIKAMELNGFYRLFSFDYEFRVLSQMLDLVEENSWPLNRVNKRETLETLNNLVSESILEHFFDYYTTESEEVEGTQFYKYDEEKICRIFAQYILKDAGKFNLNDFLEVWKNSVPEGMIADLDMLKGIALYDTNSNPQVIWAFQESKLPENLHDRFKILFQTKEKWKVEEIAPYIQNYTTDKVDVNLLLTKHARGSTQNNIRYYSAKHSK